MEDVSNEELANIFNDKESLYSSGDEEEEVKGEAQDNEVISKM